MSKDIYTLGISCYYHDSAAALLKNDEIIAAAQEERFTRIKNYAGFPKNAIKFCLDHEGISIEELSSIVYYESAEKKFKRVCQTIINKFPRSIRFAIRVIPSWLIHKLHWKQKIQLEIDNIFDYRFDKKRIYSVDHHLSHAASAFYPTNWNEAAVLVVDGVGEFETVSIWHGKGNRLEKKYAIEFPNSIGLLYSAFTYYTGFKVNSGEYKVMGLAPYGEPKYVETIKKFLISLGADGSFQINTKYFDYEVGERIINQDFERLFGGRARSSEADVTQREMDLARSIQDITNEVIYNLAKKAKEITGATNLCMAGGVALNCVANGILERSKIFESLWIQPAAGDAGSAIGCALQHYYEKNPRKIYDAQMDNMKGSYLGPSYSNDEVFVCLSSVGAKFIKISDPDAYVAEVAKSLAAGKVVGWHQGRMEFGPRALGARSILGDPRNVDMQTTMNLKIKYRESFRPFAPSVMEEDASKYFKIAGTSPYMLIVAPISEAIKIDACDDSSFGIAKLKQIRSELPAVTHVDYSARVQTVSKNTNIKYHRLLSAFKDLTGCSVLVNSSFNVRGEPIVCTPLESFKCFMRTEMDVLAIEDFILYKNEQGVLLDDIDWRQEFELD